MSKPSLPQGTRDFTADTLRKRSFILNTIRAAFEAYGFEPLETPAMEQLDTLMGKYGEEGDRLIFKILNNGLHEPGNHDKATEGFQKVLAGKNSTQLTERALKYDLTIPFARFVAMNHGKLTFPYKRYQIQPVWRADRPQKGRYREFTQCDADVVGSTSLLNEADLANIYHTVFTKLNLPEYSLRINSRKLLAALAEACGNSNLLTPISVAIDKLDKIGWEKVQMELMRHGLTNPQLSFIEQYLSIAGDNVECIEKARLLFDGNATATEGLAELSAVLQHTPNCNIRIDLTLARGLNYYTGIIFEVSPPPDVRIGSIGGGGRYDNLTALFGVPDLTGVGISFGVDRIYDVLDELNRFPEGLTQGTRVLFMNMGEETIQVLYQHLQQLRSKSIACEIYPDAIKLEKQFKYADKKNIPFAVLIGSHEMAQQQCVVKNLRTGEQQAIPLSSLASFIGEQD
ncbi:MAG: histidine--tRNA ligase [Ferruginibacter sp.]